MPSTLEYVLAAAAISAPVYGILRDLFKRGEREADFVTCDELKEFHKELRQEFAPKGETNQRIDFAEISMAEVKRDVRTIREEMTTGFREVLRAIGHRNETPTKPGF